MTQLRYIGSTALLIPAAGLHVQPGTVVDVTDPNVAAELAAREDFTTSTAGAAGTVAELLALVDGDPARAAEQLAAELARSQPRKSLVAQLTQLADQAPDLDNEDATSADLTDPEENTP